MKTNKEIVESVKPSVTSAADILYGLTNKPINERFTNNEAINILSDAFDLLKKRDMKGRTEVDLVQFLLETYDSILRTSVIKALDGEKVSPAVLHFDTPSSIATEIKPKEEKITLKPSPPDVFITNLMYAKDKFCDTSSEKLVLDKVLGRVVAFKKKADSAALVKKLGL